MSFTSSEEPMRPLFQCVSIKSAAKVLLFPHIRKFLRDFMRFFCLFAFFFVILQRESANNGYWQCDAG